MKKMVLAIVCIAFYVFLSSCAVDRKVIGRTFQSNYPKLNIQIDTEFKYLEKIERVYHGDSINKTQTLRYDEEYYLFVSDAKEHNDKRYLYIYFGRVETSYVDNNATNKSNLDFGVLKFDGNDFKYYTRTTRPSTNSRSTKYYMDAGYILPSCGLFSALYIIPYKDLWVTIYYLEDATPSGISCDSNYSIDTLSKEQKEYLKGFHNRALAAIGIGDTTKKQSLSMATKGKSQPTNKPLENKISFEQRLEKSLQPEEKVHIEQREKNEHERFGNEIMRDGRFIEYDNGTVIDTKTGLMWAAKDNGSDINWTNAKRYCENYRVGGYADWRMPTQEELAGLYDSAESYRTDCGYSAHLTDLIRLTCLWAWSSETRSSEASGFLFLGGVGYWDPKSSFSNSRVLPVRLAK